MKTHTAKKPVSRSSKPVLTSPWKIGFFVSLLLVVVSLGVGYYFARVYHVKLAWLDIRPEMGLRGWKIDSFGFFREMYPLVAVVTLVSLFAYFLVASAVHRYRFYFASGQDYRKMISLAESVDDLTNPAQIARLSSYPELQAVLRSYGDQIRDISRDLGQRQESVSFDEIDGDVDALLRGEELPGQVLGTKPYAAAFGRITERLAADQARVEELERFSEADHRAIGRTALSLGRIMEVAGGAGEQLMEIAKSVNELDRIARGLEESAPWTQPAPGSAPQGLKTIAAGVEGAVRKLEDSGRVFQELSEENNGIAISLALMAARGQVEEQALATFAERVRVTAERFHQLSGAVTGVAKALLGACYELKEAPAEHAAPAAAAPADPMLHQGIIRVARAIEDRSAGLQKHLCSLASELHEVLVLLQHDFPPGAAAVEERASEPSVLHERVEAEEPPVAADIEEMQRSDDFLVDHGSKWAGIGGAREEVPDAAANAGAAAAAPTVEEPQKAPERSAASNAGDFSDMSSLRNLDGTVPGEPPLHGEAKPDEAGGWMEMPGHRWLKIDVERNEADETRDVEVTVAESPSPACGRSPVGAHRTPDADVAASDAWDIEAAQHGEPETALRRDAQSSAAEDTEPVHDLFDLGAVEYVEEIQAKG